MAVAVDLCLAIDIGGTKLAAGLVTSSGELLAAHRVPTPRTDDAEVLFAAVAGLVDLVHNEATAPDSPTRGANLIVAGVGCGGPMDPDRGTVSPLNIPAWRDFPLCDRLEDITGLGVELDNDAKAFALAEGWTGAARQRHDYLAMVVSTGVGGGLVVDNRLLDGASGNAGHVGHVIVEPDGRLCACGAHGCLEAEASGTAIAAVTGRTPEHAGPDVVERTGRLVGRAVASVVSLLDIGLAVVGGSVALGFGAPFFEAANTELHARARLSFTTGADIVPSGLGTGGPLVGAGALGWRAAQRGLVEVP
ncbi:MAG TPA: ROK family protein [Acidimicrobiales bacterium]|nr:ROK family protein [Acidimicrobiales bacterium]